MVNSHTQSNNNSYQCNQHRCKTDIAQFNGRFDPRLILHFNHFSLILSNSEFKMCVSNVSFISASAFLPRLYHRIVQHVFKWQLHKSQQQHARGDVPHTNHSYTRRQASVYAVCPCGMWKWQFAAFLWISLCFKCSRLRQITQHITRIQQISNKHYLSCLSVRFRCSL